MIARRWVNFRYYGADDTSVFNGLVYIFLAPILKRLVPDQKPLGELRPGPTYMAGEVKTSATNQY